MTETTNNQTAVRDRNGIVLHALIGAVLIFLLSFLLVSPVLGGNNHRISPRTGWTNRWSARRIVRCHPSHHDIMAAIALFTPVTPTGSTMSPLVGFVDTGFAMLVLVSIYTAGLGGFRRIQRRLPRRFRFSTQPIAVFRR